MADTYTTNLNLTKPEPGAAEDTWGISLNADLDALDAIFSTSGTQINLNPNQINFADGKKAIFGNSSDLQIYHDGSHSFIRDGGTGHLKIQATNLKLQDESGNNYIDMIDGSYVRLMHNANPKLETTSTGIDVTGTVTATDEFRGEVVNYASNQDAPYLIAGTSGYTGATTNWNTYGFQHRIKTNANGLARITIDTNSAEAFNVTNNNRIGIGTSSPQSKLTLENGLQRINATDGSSDARIQFTMTNGSNYPSGWIGIPNWNKDGLYIFGPTANGSEVAALYTEARWQFHTGNSERARLTNAGDLLVGKTTTSTGVAGARFSANGFANVTRDGAECINFNRLTSDGTIIDLRKDSTTVGKISSYSSGLDIAGSSYGVRFAGSTIFPVTSAGSVSDNVVSLGYSGGRFKDLHLSGTANFGSLSDGTITITGFVDQDDMSSDSATLLPTQQSVKAYVDANSFTINNNADNRIITGTANAGTLNAETTLTYGTTGADLAITGGSIGGVPPILRLEDVGSSGKLAELNHITGTTTLTSRNATSNGVIKFAGHNGTSETEYGRFDSSGNLLVGKTSAGIANVGVESRQNGLLFATADGSDVLKLNRLTSDGAIQEFRKDSAVVGSIGTNGGNLTISGTTNKAGLYLSGNNIAPMLSNTRDDAEISLGTSTFRFTDLHLSGQAYASYFRPTPSSADFINFSSGNIRFATGSSEKVRIDTGGSLLVGKTSADIGTIGHQFLSDAAGDYAAHTSNGNRALLLNRLNSDGQIADFRKDGTTVGSIGTQGSVIRVGSGNNNLGFFATRLQPLNSSGVGVDGTIDLGYSTSRFKDLHLSGKAYLNTSSGAKLVLQTDATRGFIGTSTSHDLILETAAVERMRINSSGNVGIGTSSPSYNLDLLSSNAVSMIRTGDTTSPTLGLFVNSGSNGVGTISVDNGGHMTFDTGATGAGQTERMRIDSTGNVGIGTSTISRAPLEIHRPSTGDCQIHLTNTYTGTGASNGTTIYANTNSGIWHRENGYFNIATNNTERMRIDSSGRLIVGGTSAGQTGATTIYPNGNIASSSITATGDGVFNFFKTETFNPVLTANDSESDTGQIIAVQIGGTTKGNIGISSATGNDMYIASGTTSSAGFGLRFIDYTVTEAALPCRGDGSTADNAMDLGNSGSRFDDIYATNGTINTSDRNEKQDIQALTDAEQRVATACKGLIRRFRWQDAVEEKGDDARLHFGVIAQDLQDAFTAEGLDAGDYGMFISSTWTDDEGNEQTRLGVRYNELLAFIITTL
ncbi:hypothetical protein [uncultured Mediterranean phage uvMED]|nr:hypothetical protein [uncultured Mediterranean phage uvMED]BAQ90437.1 hypothetical protein [uncultured Mediterranean phage uvMED]